VDPEALDSLMPEDPAARRARRDLQRIHRFMGTQGILLRLLKNLPAPRRILELGAGDGRLMLGVARRLAGIWPSVELTLLDRQAVVEDQTLQAYADLGWTAVCRVADVFEWARSEVAPEPGRAGLAPWDLILVNLFLHHFEAAPVARLLDAVAARSANFIAVEPHRSRLALSASHLVGIIGASPVTRMDAVLSVRAGFLAGELSALWPDAAGAWRVCEFPVGLFSHAVVASRGERL
jgi:hypothetical protein